MDLHLAVDMPYESGLIDGDLPHALERVLPTSVLVAAGYKLLPTARATRQRKRPKERAGVCIQLEQARQLRQSAPERLWR